MRVSCGLVGRFVRFSFYLPRLFSCSHFAASSMVLTIGFLPFPKPIPYMVLRSTI